MYPVERSLVQKFAGRPFAIVGVNSDTNMERLKPVLKAEKITWRSFQDGPDDSPESISSQWGVRAWPSFFLIDATGTIQKLKSRGESALEKNIEELLSKMAV